MPDFLGHLKDAAASPIALVSFILVVAAWAYKIYLANEPKRKAPKIVELFRQDGSQRLDALKQLLGGEPPERLKTEEAVLKWVAQETKRKTHKLTVICYIVTLFAIIVVISMALFTPKTEPDAQLKPKVVDSHAEHPSK